MATFEYAVMADDFQVFDAMTFDYANELLHNSIAWFEELGYTVTTNDDPYNDAEYYIVAKHDDSGRVLTQTRWEVIVK